ALSESPRIEINVKDVSVSEALEKCLEGLPLNYVVKDNNIIISKREVENVEQQQDREITGRVTTEQGTPLEGVTVSLKNTQSASITDSKGDYRITIAEGGTTLVFS